MCAANTPVSSHVFNVFAYNHRQPGYGLTFCMKINWLYINVITEVVEDNFGKGNDKYCTGNCLLM